VDFLGRPAWSTRIPALLARKCGVPRLPVFIHREGECQVVTIHPEIPFREGEEGSPEERDRRDTAQLNAAIEAYVVAHPTEWYWIHKRWKRAPAAGTPGSSGEGEQDAS
jgi:KDO2-lipid IV(A) lauroyltransferase